MTSYNRFVFQWSWKEQFRSNLAGSATQNYVLNTEEAENCKLLVAKPDTEVRLESRSSVQLLHAR